MKLVRYFTIALALSFASIASAQNFEDYEFAQERMLCAEDGIYIISTFEDSDHVTAYGYAGNKLWDRSFFAKITSWQVIGNRIVVFSKHRNGNQTYLTCINRFSGDLIWQRP